MLTDGSVAISSVVAGDLPGGALWWWQRTAGALPRDCSIKASLPKRLPVAAREQVTATAPVPVITPMVA